MNPCMYIALLIYRCPYQFALKCVRSGPTGSCPRLVAPRVRKTGSSGGLASLAVLLAAGLLRQLSPLPSAVEPEAIAVSCQCTCPAAPSTPCPAVWCEAAPELPAEVACLPTWQLVHFVAIAVALFVGAGFGCCIIGACWVLKRSQERVPAHPSHRGLVRIDRW